MLKKEKKTQLLWNSILKMYFFFSQNVVPFHCISSQCFAYSDVY